MSGVASQPAKTARTTVPPKTFRDEPNGAMGTEDLCAWSVAPGVWWIQTRAPEFARKLQRRGDTRLVAWSVAGGYLRTFAISTDRRKMVRDLLRRYLGSEAPPLTVANEHLAERKGPWNALKSLRASRQRTAKSTLLRARRSR